MLLVDEPDLSRAEPNTLRYRLLHTAARITREQRKVFLRLAEHWPWALALARAFTPACGSSRSRPEAQHQQPAHPHEDHGDTGHRAGSHPRPPSRPRTSRSLPEVDHAY